MTSLSSSHNNAAAADSSGRRGSAGDGDGGDSNTNDGDGADRVSVRSEMGNRSQVGKEKGGAGTGENDISFIHGGAGVESGAAAKKDLEGQGEDLKAIHGCAENDRRDDSKATSAVQTWVKK